MYQNQVKLTRPAGVEWFTVVDPITTDRYRTWLNGQPGFVFHNASVDLVTGDINIEQYWTDQASYDAMVEARQANADYRTKKDYESAVGITTTVIYRGEI